MPADPELFWNFRNSFTGSNLSEKICMSSYSQLNYYKLKFEREQKMISCKAGFNLFAGGEMALEDFCNLEHDGEMIFELG